MIFLPHKLFCLIKAKEYAMAKELSSTPRADGFWMPGEYEPQQKVFMVWPERTDTWRAGAKPAQKSYADVAEAISRFTAVTMLVSHKQFENARAKLPEKIRVIEMSNNDAWVRDSGPTFVVDGKGGLRLINWDFNAWGGLYDGLYFPWDFDDMIPRKIAELENVDFYSTPGFVLEGGSFHVDGEGTVITTEMCLLSPGRNPDLGKDEIEAKLGDYLGVDKVIWVKDGIDPDETNGHIDDVACFVRPGEVACIWTEDENNPFYAAAQAAYAQLSAATDAKGRQLKVHKLTLPKKPVLLSGAEWIDAAKDAPLREDGEICIGSYMNFLITNKGIITPQYDDEYDALALKQLAEIFPEHEIVGVPTKEVVFGGGNIHCITQQMPAV
jgi:agmatine deiminase